MQAFKIIFPKISLIQLPIKLQNRRKKLQGIMRLRLVKWQKLHGNRQNSKGGRVKKNNRRN